MRDIGRVSYRSGSELDRSTHAVDLAVSGLASEQQGLVTLEQAVERGMTSRMVHVRVRSGFLHPIFRGVFAVGHRPTSDEAWWLAAVLACGDGALLSHRSAAALWEIRGSAAASIDVTAHTRRGYAQRGIAVHRATTIAPIDYDLRRGVPVTSLPRTIVDLATVVSFGALEYAIHRAEAQRKLKPAHLHEILARLPGKKGTAAVRAIIGRPHHDLDALTRSLWERRFLAICRAHKVPEPRVNDWIALEIASGGLEVDFSWPRHRLVVEVDEDASHHTLRAKRNDPERDRALRTAGWRVARVAEKEFAQPSLVAEKVWRALQPAEHRSAAGPPPNRHRSS
jgi:hypothetical protein